MGNADDKPIVLLLLLLLLLLLSLLLLLLLLFIALKSHVLSVNLIYFDAISCSHADTSISHALALFWWVAQRYKLSEVLMNSEFVPSLALNFDQCSICSSAINFLVSCVSSG